MKVFKFIVMSVLGVALFTGCTGCSNTETKDSDMVEDSLVWYPGRTFSYKIKFNDLQSKQHDVASRIGLPHPPKDRADAASMRKSWVEIRTNDH